MEKQGLLIALEGIDGSGKSTLAQSIYNYLVSKNYPVLLTKEPGGTQLGQHLRSILQERKFGLLSRAELMLFMTDRAQHFEEKIIPALKQNKIVISDRLSDSSLAYQGYGRGLDKEVIKYISNWSMFDYNPNIIFYLKLDYHMALERILSRGEKLTVFEQEKKDFFKRVITGFDEILSTKAQTIILDASKSPQVVYQQAINSINKILINFQ